MKFIEKLIDWVGREGEVPEFFGTLHLAFILSVVALCAFLFIHLRDASDRAFRISIGVMAAVMIVGEVLKQILLGLSIENGAVIYTYNWSDFPFQLCSTPLYVLPFLSFLPDCRLRDFCASYVMTIGLIGGVAVYLAPKSVFTTRIFTNFHTMIHHGLQIVSGMYTAFYYRRRLNRRFFHDGIAVFGVTFTIANVLNTAGYDALVSMGKIAEGDPFNMFYISPRADQTVPMCSEMFKSLPPVVFIFGYFILLSFLAWYVIDLAKFIHRKSRRRMHLKMEGIK